MKATNRKCQPHFCEEWLAMVFEKLGKGGTEPMRKLQGFLKKNRRKIVWWHPVVSIVLLTIDIFDAIHKWLS